MRLVSRRVEALRLIDGWPARTAAAGVVTRTGIRVTRGPREAVFRWASVTKPVAVLAALVALEEGSVDLDDAAGPHGATLRHLLAHASGLPLNEGPVVAEPGRRRIYSNAGFEAAFAHIGARTGIRPEQYVAEAVMRPLGTRAELVGSPAWGMRGSLDDLLAFAEELLTPTIVAAETLGEATSVAFPDLVGVLPGFGRMEPNDWGLGFELRNDKSPHWTGARNSRSTYGHFGAAGTFVWVDPDVGIACACLTDLEFGDWAKRAWPRLSDAVLEELE